MNYKSFTETHSRVLGMLLDQFRKIEMFMFSKINNNNYCAHGLLNTRPNMLLTENRVGEFWTILDHVTLLSAFIGMSRMHSDHFIFFGKLLGEIWVFPTFSLQWQ